MVGRFKERIPVGPVKMPLNFLKDTPTTIAGRRPNHRAIFKNATGKEGSGYQKRLDGVSIKRRTKYKARDPSIVIDDTEALII